MAERGQGRINKFSAPGQIIEGAHVHPPETIASRALSTKALKNYRLLKFAATKRP